MKVAVAVIFDKNHRVLIVQRPHHVPHGGLWEFPGGKLNENESAPSALIREIKEEIGIDIVEFQCLGELDHYYGQKHVHFYVFSVKQYIGDVVCCEGQLDIRWVDINTLAFYSFPEANRKIIQLLHNDFALKE